MHQRLHTHYTQEELNDWLTHLSSADRERVLISARFYSLRSGVDANDLIHDAVVRLMTRSANRKYPLLQVLFGIIRSVASGRLEAQRHFAVEGLPEGAEPEFHSAPPAPDDQLISAEINGAIAKAIEALPEGERTVVLLAYRDGLSQSEIASRLGLALGTVKSRIRLATERLRRMLEPHRKDG
jgi:RNA polymerase sigma factor (sigma-70 family)